MSFPPECRRSRSLANSSAARSVRSPSRSSRGSTSTRAPRLWPQPVSATPPGCANPGRIADIDAAAAHLEGYLFPDTYRFAPGTSEREIADTLVAAFRRQFDSRVRPLRAAGDSRPLRELVILASLVEKEAKLDAERPLIAAVYANRLRLGIGLYADPTIIHALKLLGRWNGNLTKSDLRMESPWNTYRVAGLPPGPICSPGLASLQAAARPADVSYIYFVSRNDGSHVFADSLAEHNRNVERWQKRPWRARAAGR